MKTIFQIEDLCISFFTYAGEVQAVRGVDITLAEGETLGVVGESGSGKSVTTSAALGILPETATIKNGRILLEGKDLVKLNNNEMRKIRSKEISMIFQDPMSSLNPLMKIGAQLEEAIIEHFKDLSAQEVQKRALQLLEDVKIPDVKSRYNAYPHQLSGGMRQRVMIAMALSCNPKVVVADEPTTALDVTIQSQIVSLLKNLQKTTNTAIIFITHDLGLVAEMCDRIAVMYGGLVMEEATTTDLFQRPSHPYTLALLQSIPRLDQDKSQKLMAIAGSPPDMADPPKGCPFYPRCTYARQICIDQLPAFYDLAPNHKSRCWLLDDNAPKEDNPFAKNGQGLSGGDLVE